MSTFSFRRSLLPFRVYEFAPCPFVLFVNYSRALYLPTRTTSLYLLIYRILFGPAAQSIAVLIVYFPSVGILDVPLNSTSPVIASIVTLVDLQHTMPDSENVALASILLCWFRTQRQQQMPPSDRTTILPSKRHRRHRLAPSSLASGSACTPPDQPIKVDFVENTVYEGHAAFAQQPKRASAAR